LPNPQLALVASSACAHDDPINSADEFAIAVLDRVEKPRHFRQGFTVAY
jgi:putative NADH-flavin reductase